MANLEHAVAAKNDTVFRIASISKPLTATAVMQLVEQGKIDLDAPIQKYVPAFPAKPDATITVRQLLCHQSGIRHYKRDEALHTEHYDRLAGALALFKDDPLEHAPGAKLTYSTYAYTLLGLAIEQVSGQSYIDYMREHVFQPAGMDHTFADDSVAIIPDRASGYARRPNNQIRNAFFEDTSYKMPGGGLLSTATDLVNFALAAQDGRLIKPETFVQMTTKQKTSNGESTVYGFGWFIDLRGPKDGGERTNIGHGGAQQGTTSDLLVRPKHKTAIAILANVEEARLVTLGDEIAAILAGVPASTQPTSKEN
jgi:CubicO group peptidase (beta-lactamase class C family)